MKKLFIAAVLSLTIPAFSQETSQPVDWKTLFQQLFVWNIWKNHDLAKGTYTNAWEKAVYYTPINPNNVYDLVRNATSSENANKLRDELFGFSSNRKYLQPGLNLENVSGIDQLYNSGAGELLSLISSQRSVRNNPSQNYFDTKIGQAVLESLRDTVMVVIPGFGSHTIPDYTYPELVEAANTYYGRPAKRVPTKDPNTGESVYVGENSPEEFYQERTGAPEMKFDVVHPLGYELGNSMTKDQYTATDLKNWIEALPARYKDKKLILVGYSKGAPIAHNAVQMFESIRNRTSLILTLAGANQGSIAAQGGIDALLTLTRSESPEEAVAKMETQQALLKFFVQNVLTSLTPIVNPEQAAYFSGTGGSSIFALFGLVGNVADTKNFVQAIDGVRDLTNFERTKWNLVHLNDQDFKQPLTVMNLSVITNARDFFYPEPVNGGPVKPPLAVPQFLKGGDINTLLFSRDAVFLHLTSILGFLQSPAGLFDTQVAWMDSKGMPLDKRNLGESLTDDRLRVLAKQVKEITGVDLPKGWETMSRDELLKAYNQSRGLTMNNLNFVDLGEVRGNHWDISFRQVYKPETGEYYEHRFPRKGALTALVETAAIWAKAKEPAITELGQERGGQP